MLLYHGSIKIIKTPTFGFGSPTNDYGMGFYMTKDIEKAKEWSSDENIKTSYINIYDLDVIKLKLLDIDTLDNKVLKWMALLVKNRAFNIKTNIALQGKEYLINNYLIDTNQYDIIKGYRADDCYFMFARSFLNNDISVESLSKALILGELGDQYAIISKKGFDLLSYVGYEEVDSKKYYYKKLERNHKAACEYEDIITKPIKDEHFLIDIIRGDYK